MLYLSYEHRCDADGCDATVTSALTMCPFPAFWDRYMPHWDAVARPILPKGWTLQGIAAYCPKHTVTITVETVEDDQPSDPAAPSLNTKFVHIMSQMLGEDEKNREV